MNKVLEANTVNDRLMDAVGTMSQRERYMEHLLPEDEFRDHLRPLLLRDLAEATVAKVLIPEAYRADREKFKVLERRESKKGLTPEKYESLKAIRAACARETLVIPGLTVVREVVLVEKVVLVADKEVDTVPMALVLMEVQDPQGRCPPMCLSRRVSL